MLYSLAVAALALATGLDALKVFRSDNFILVDREMAGLRWDQAESFCKSRYETDLAKIDNRAKQTEMAQLMRDHGYTTDKQKAWLGGTDEANDGKWLWGDNSPFGYTNWNVGEPNGNSNENCLMTWPHADYRWNDGVCSKDTICPVFICNRPEDIGCNCDGRGNPCKDPDWAVRKGDLFWAWASPCSGSCSQAELLYGWRYATEEEWVNVPSKDEFYRDLPESEWCAAKIFDPVWNHCDQVNKLVRVPDNSYNEQVLVHEPCGHKKCKCAKDTPCDETGYAHLDEATQLYWAWASPCSGGCSKLVDPLPYGWRRATAEEWAAKGFKCDLAGLKFFGYDLAFDDGADGQQINSADYPNTCAANVFDDRYTHCDAINFKDGRCTYREEDHYYETLIVHESQPVKCGDEDDLEVADTMGAFAFRRPLGETAF